MLIIDLALLAVQSAEPRTEVVREAQAVIECLAGPRGTTRNCRVVQVHPSGLGLEAKALAVVRARGLPERSGLRDGMAFRVTVRFRFGDDPRPVAPEGAN